MMKKIFSTFLISFLLSGVFSAVMAAYTDNSLYCKKFRGDDPVNKCKSLSKNAHAKKCCIEEANAAASAPGTTSDDPRKADLGQKEKANVCYECDKGARRPKGQDGGDFIGPLRQDGTI